MWHPGSVDSCIFCGRPIDPDEPSVGRGESAAHAACADAALRDDAFWDRVAASGMGGEEGSGGEPRSGATGSTRPTGAERVATGDGPSSPERSGRLGCATLVVALVVLAAASHARR